MSAFRFTPDEDGTLTIHSAVFQALGYASMCWSETPKGTFESESAAEAGHALCDLLAARVAEAVQ